MNVTKMSKLELLEKCKELGIKKYKTKKKDELIDLINNHNLKKKLKKDKTIIFVGKLNAAPGFVA